MMPPVAAGSSVSVAGASQARKLDYRKVFEGRKDATLHGLTKKDLVKSTDGTISSRKKSDNGKEQFKVLKKAGRMKHLEKGSEEAKEHMRKLRKMKTCT